MANIVRQHSISLAYKQEIYPTPHNCEVVLLTIEFERPIKSALILQRQEPRIFCQGRQGTGNRIICLI